MYRDIYKCFDTSFCFMEGAGRCRKSCNGPCIYPKDAGQTIAGVYLIIYEPNSI